MQEAAGGDKIFGGALSRRSGVEAPAAVPSTKATSKAHPRATLLAKGAPGALFWRSRGLPLVGVDHGVVVVVVVVVVRCGEGGVEEGALGDVGLGLAGVLWELVAEVGDVAERAGEHL